MASDDQISRYVDGLDFDRDEVFGIFNRRLDLAALAHLAYPDHGEPDQDLQAEFGVSVLEAYRGRGFGSQLFERATLQARNRHVTSFLVHALSENKVMLKIAAMAGARIHRDGPDCEAILKLPPDTIATQVEALIEKGAAEIDYQMKWQNQAAHRVMDTLSDIRKVLVDGEAPTPH
ncbi:MAG: N-acetyltransferase family protein [Aquabacterium sp.]